MIKKEGLSIDPKKLDLIQNLSYDKKKEVLLRLPSKIMAKFYCDFCDKKQIYDLFFEFLDVYCFPDKFGDVGKPKFLRSKYKKKLVALIHCLRKNRKTFFLPLWVIKLNFNFDKIVYFYVNDYKK